MPILIKKVAGGSPDAATTFLATLGNTDNLEAAWLPGYEASYRAAAPSMLRNAVGSPASGAPQADYDLTFGHDKDVTTDKPTYNGTPGDASSSEYLSSDGGDVLSSVTVPAFLNTLCDNDAQFTILMAVYHISNAGDQYHFSTLTTGAVAGGLTLMGAGPSNTMRLTIFGSPNSNKAHTTIPGSQWNILGVSYNENTGSGTFALNGSMTDFSSFTYAGPVSSGSGGVSLMGYGASASSASGTRFGDCILWNTAIGNAALDAASAILETKYGV